MQHKNTTFYLLLLISLLTMPLVSCDDDDSSESPPEQMEENTGAFCCSGAVINLDSLNFQVYVPNSFSPNNDGINDIFFPYVKGVSEIESFQVFDLDNLVHDKKSIAPDDPFDWFWPGPDTLPASGDNVKYDYSVQLRLQDGALLDFKGEIVAINCLDQLSHDCEQDIPCYFADQYSDQIGLLNTDIATNEPCYP